MVVDLHLAVVLEDCDGAVADEVVHGLQGRLTIRGNRPTEPLLSRTASKNAPMRNGCLEVRESQVKQQVGVVLRDRRPETSSSVRSMTAPGLLRVLEWRGGPLEPLRAGPGGSVRALQLACPSAGSNDQSQLSRFGGRWRPAFLRRN